MSRGLLPFAAAVAVVTAPLATLVTPIAATASSPPGDDAACTEVTNPPGEPIVDPTATAVFGPLALEPALHVTTATPLRAASYVPGGVLLTTGAEDGPTAVTFVEESGTVRWQRCFATAPWSVDVLTAPAAFGPTAALVAAGSGDIDAGRTMQTLDIATGVPTPLQLGGADEPRFHWDDDHGFALFGPSLEAVDLAAGSTMTLVDLATLATTDIPTPDVPADVAFPSYRVGAAGVVGLGGRNGNDASIALLYIDGAWSADPAAIDASFPLWTSYGSDEPITFHRASGALAWSLPDVLWPSDEGFHDALVGDVVIIRGCSRIEPDTLECQGAVLLGVDALTGTELWRREGGGGVDAAADGFALVSAPTDDATGDWSHTMIDVTTGEPVEGQRWPELTFITGCCGDPAFTAVDGGVVLTSDGSGVEVYLPATEATPTVDVAL